MLLKDPAAHVVAPVVHGGERGVVRHAPLRDETREDAVQRAGVVEAKAREVEQAVGPARAEVAPCPEGDGTLGGVEGVVAHVGALSRHLLA